MSPSSKKDILFIGWDPYTLDPSEFPPNVDADKIQAGLDGTATDAAKENFSCDLKMLDSKNTPAEFAANIVKHLETCEYKIIAIGNGVRSFPKYMLHFEAGINAIHRATGKETKIVFNTMPHDTMDAVKRWI